jgi:hypothetical protein
MHVPPIAPPQTILHSAELVGLNVLQLMSDNAAGMDARHMLHSL